MAQRTKKALAASLKKLMNQTTLDKITVKEIATDCEVNRQTFYYHFKDTYDLLGWIYKSEVLPAINEYQDYATWQEGFLIILNYLLENKKFCLNSFNSLGREHLEKFLYGITFDLLMGVVNELSQGTSINEENKTFISNFYCYAFIGLVTEWIRSGMKQNPEKIIADLSKLIQGDIKNAITKYI